MSEGTLIGDRDLFAPLRDLHLQFPSLEDFQYQPLDLTPLPEPFPSVEVEEDENLERSEPSIWQLDSETVSEHEKQRLKTWETFRDWAHVESCPYLSEAGPRAFDAWLALSYASSKSTSDECTITKRTIKPDSFLRSLYSLALGRESTIFKYDASKKRFCVRCDGLLLSGYSSESINSLVDSFVDGGSGIRAIDLYIQRVYRSIGANPTIIAFAQALSTVTRSLRTCVLRNAGSIQSLLQLQSVFTTPFSVIRNLRSVLERVKDVREGHEVVTILFNHSEHRDDLDLSFRIILVQILARVSVPCLRSLESSIGLRSGDVDRSLNIYNGSASNDSIVRNGVPSECPAGIITDEDLSIVNEINRSRRILQTHLPDHVLSRGGNHDGKQPPSLEWGFGWDDVERIQAKANLYENSLLEAMNSSSMVESSLKVPQSPKGTTSMGSPFNITTNEVEEYIKESRAAFECPLPDPWCDNKDDPLVMACRAAVSKRSEIQSEFTPPLAIVPSLSFSPIIAAQARLVNLACLRLVFKEHKLQQHLSIQRRFHLLGDGVFVSRFSNALFNPDLPMSQRRTGRIRGGTVGLNLGFRESWPPATSELRLALIGILRDCIHNSDEAGLIDRDGELPGGLSFSIRDLSDKEIEKCLDPDSVEALDFLRLQYKPPPPLDEIFTQSSLDKYDQIFKLLLRVTRMIYVVNGLYLERRRRSRSQSSKPCAITERFRVDAHRFISIISDYFTQDGIVPIWSHFESSLEHIASRITGDRQRGEISEHDGLRQIQETHEKVLDHIKFALLSRKRQEKAMQVLEEIFRSILLFAKESRNARDSTVLIVKALYETFMTKVGAFILLCRELSAKKGLRAKGSYDSAKGTLFSQQGRGELGEENTLSRLLLKLEMNGYFSGFCRVDSTSIPHIE